MLIHDLTSTPLTDTGVTLQTVRDWGAPGRTRVDLITLPAGTSLPTHAAGSDQTMVVVQGSGQVAGADGVRTDVTPGQAVSWDHGEQHTTWAVQDLTVLVVQHRP